MYLNQNLFKVQNTLLQRKINQRYVKKCFSTTVNNSPNSANKPMVCSKFSLPVGYRSDFSLICVII
jgi:hypothetical protein